MLNPFEIPANDALEVIERSEGTALEEVTGTEETTTTLDAGGVVKPCYENGANSPADSELLFYLADDKGTIKESKIDMNEPVVVKGVSRRLNVLVCWPEKSIQQYDTCLLSSLPEVFKSGILARRPQESVSLYKCLEAFLKEEPLGPEDMWSVCTSWAFYFSFENVIHCLLAMVLMCKIFEEVEMFSYWMLFVLVVQ